MPKRGDNIHKRKDGRWEGRYKKCRKPDGTIQYGSVYGKSYQEAKRKLRQATAMPAPAQAVGNHEKTFGEALALWMESNRTRLKGGTISKYQSLMDAHILPGLGQVKLSAITPAMVNGFLARKMDSGRLDRMGGLSASYARSMALLVSAAMRFAAEEGMCQPLRTPICKPRAESGHFSILSLEEQRRLEGFLLLNPTPTKAGVLISLHAGLRIGEVCALSWDNVDFGERVIRVRHTVARVRNTDASSPNATKLIIDSPKTRASARDIPISSGLLPALLAASNSATSRYVASQTDGFVSPRTFEYRYHRLLDEVGIVSVNYHALRHTFATRCMETGMDAKSLSEILGHSSVGVTLGTYVHPSMDMKRSQLEKLSSLTRQPSLDVV